MMINNTSNQIIRFAAMAVAVSLALTACGKKEGTPGANQGKKQTAEGKQPPPPQVGVVTVHQQNVVLNTELPGRLASLRTADVRAQVGGIVKSRLFEEGSYIRAGQPLYQLDNASYLANLESTRASLAAAEATLAKADADLSRYRPLVEADAISKQEYDAAVSAKRSGAAGVKSARAAIRSAQINVDYSRITAPISGYIGQSFVSEGALVSANDATKMATIQQTNPLYVNITQSATEMMKLRQQIADGKLVSSNGRVPVTVLMEDGTEYAEKGTLLFSDPTVDETTGQVTLRASVPNDQNILLPGLYVRVKLPLSSVANAYVVPQQAVTRGQKDTVMVVNSDGSMAPREVTVAAQLDGNWVLTSGLKDGDKVIVNGLMIAGMSGAKKVTPVESNTQAGGQASASSPAAVNSPESKKPATPVTASSEAKAASATK